MQYLMLDTNIYLDLLFWRDSNAPPDTFAYLRDILSERKATLVVPDVVEREFERNASREVKRCREELGRLSETCRKAPYPQLAGAHTFREFIDKTVRELETWKNKLDDAGILDETMKQFRELMSHDLVVKVETDASILQGITKRRVFKRCPFHRNSKEEYADAAIIEMLVTFADRVPSLSTDEPILFLTRNHEDFCDPEDRDVLHPELLEDLRAAGLEVHYSRSAYKTLKERFGAPVAPEVLEAEDKVVHDPSLSLGTQGWHSDQRIAEFYNSLPIAHLDQLARMVNEKMWVISGSGMEQVAEEMGKLAQSSGVQEMAARMGQVAEEMGKLAQSSGVQEMAARMGQAQEVHSALAQLARHADKMQEASMATEQIAKQIEKMGAASTISEQFAKQIEKMGAASTISEQFAKQIEKMRGATASVEQILKQVDKLRG